MSTARSRGITLRVILHCDQWSCSQSASRTARLKASPRAGPARRRGRGRSRPARARSEVHVPLQLGKPVARRVSRRVGKRHGMSKRGNRFLRQQTGINQGFDVYDDVGGLGRAEGEFALAERRAEAVVTAARGWIDGQSKPWLAWVHVFDPHAPYAPPAPFDQQYAGSEYAGEVAYVDQALGPLLEAARSSSPSASAKLAVAPAAAGTTAIPKRRHWPSIYWNSRSNANGGWRRSEYQTVLTSLSFAIFGMKPGRSWLGSVT